MQFNHKGSADERTRLQPKVKAFLAMTPPEVDQYVAANVTNLGTAKEVIGTLAMLLRVMASEIQVLKARR